MEDETAHNIDEFFVTRKYRRQGVGKAVALMTFEMFKGKWEVCQMQDNIRAQKFWMAVISEYTNGDFQQVGTPNDEMIGFILNNADI